MKTILKSAIIYLYLISSSVIFKSCTEEFLLGDRFLVKPPSVDINLDSLFQDSEKARGVLWNAYTTLYYGLNWDWSARGVKMGMGLSESLTDIYHSYLSWDAVNSLYYTGLYNSSTESKNSAYYFNDGESQWTGIRKAYIFLENIDKVPNMDNDEKARLKAEAKMIIACLYSDMFRHFGGLPLLKGTLNLNNGKDYISRSTVRETLAFITNLCDEAYEILPWQLSDDEYQKWNGRFTGAAAKALKIRVMLFAASPLFNDDTPYYKDYSESNDKLLTWLGKKDITLWNDLEEECKEFMDMLNKNPESFSLVQTGKYDDDFRDGYFKRGSRETIISTRIRDQVPGPPWGVWDANYYFLQSAAFYGSLNPTLEYLDLFPMSDGTPFDNSIWENKPKLKESQNPFANRDPRLAETCLVNGVSKKENRTAETWIGGRERANAAHSGGTGTGAGNYKFLFPVYITGVSLEAHWPYIRLAEIYLSYAEILNELYGPIPEAIEYLNKTRLRVGLKPIQEVNPSAVATKESMLSEILDERAREFGVEEVRIYDINRYKLENKYRQRLHGIDIYKSIETDPETQTATAYYTYDKYVISKRYIQDGENGTVYFNPKWYLSAFPIKEVNKGYLIQNPGW